MEYAFYLLTFIFHFFIYAVVFRLAGLFTKNMPIKLFAVLLLARSQFRNLGDAGNINDNYITPQLLAMPFALSGIYFAAKEKYFLAFFSILIALPIHPSLTILTGITIAASLILVRFSLPRFSKSLLFLAVTAALSYLFFLQFSGKRLVSDGLYIYILAYLRHPHHYIPSTFPLWDYVVFSLMAVAVPVSLKYLPATKTVKKSIISMYVVALTLVVFGYMFVEIIPIRTMVELQLFRIVFLVRLFAILVVIVALAGALVRKIGLRPTYVMLGFASIPLLFFSFSKGVRLIPNLPMQFESDRMLLYEFVAKKTESSALFLTPPNFGSMRIIPKRAIVVDWKSFPFIEKYMLIWHQRIEACYGKGDLFQNYRNITDTKLLSLKKTFQFDYVILYSSTKTKFRVLYEDSIYKVVRPL
ncbi:MAG: DUF6798 domain-containing protein [Patescibacteria group bacterium]|jgi:hypothetical protein